MYALVKKKALIVIFKVASKDNYQQFCNQNQGPMLVPDIRQNDSLKE